MTLVTTKIYETFFFEKFFVKTLAEIPGLGYSLAEEKTKRGILL